MVAGQLWVTDGTVAGTLRNVFDSLVVPRVPTKVEKGQVLFQMDPTQARATLEIQQNQLDAAFAQEVRLLAERDGDAELVFLDVLRGRTSELTVARAIEDQTKEFNELTRLVDWSDRPPSNENRPI
jgi:multidrug resistance efflux pump